MGGLLVASVSLRRIFEQSKRVKNPVVIGAQDLETLEAWILRDKDMAERIRAAMQANPEYWTLTPDQLAHRLADHPGIGAASATLYATMYAWAIKLRRSR